MISSHALAVTSNPAQFRLAGQGTTAIAERDARYHRVAGANLIVRGREGGCLETIQDLLGQIRKGEIVLPEFQRGYVWNKDQVRLFTGSLYRGHPTGHFLIWKTYKPSKTRGTVTPGDGHSRLLLDGQQRLTSLYTLFEGNPPPFYEGEELFFNLYFNVVTEEFRFWQKTIMEGDPSWISVHRFLKEGIQNFIKSLPSIDEPARSTYTEHLDRLARLDDIRNYRYQLARHAVRREPVCRRGGRDLQPCQLRRDSTDQG